MHVTKSKILLTGEDFIPFQFLKSSACYTKKWVLFQVKVDHLAYILKGKLTVYAGYKILCHPLLIRAI